MSGEAAATSQFAKYRQRGAYHWDALSRHPWRHDAFTAARYGAVLEAAAPQRGERIADIGCGDAALTCLLWRASGGDVVGVEPEATGRQLAASQLARHGAAVRLAASTGELADASQDLVVCAEVIEHVADPVALVEEIRRLLRPGGRAVISTPIRLTERPLDPEHVQEFFPEQFRDLVARVLPVERQVRCCPVFAIELYWWRPWIFLRRGLLRVGINVLSAWGGVQLLRTVDPLARHYMTQLVVCRRS
jgi:2-polyprenyl-3-methyl-5-hydroxy-6-metoxy-1,4-benzoquinol methylase